jgi:transcriptional regulator with XRE-family HTH domain
MTRSRPGEVEKQFGAQVRQVRRSKGYSQIELARLANVSRSAIVNLESGAGSSLATLTKVLEALDRSDWLLSLEVPGEVFNPLDLLDRNERKGPGPGGRSTPRRAPRSGG